MRYGCIGSGSDGNCHYLINDGGEILIIDAGLGIATIKKGIGFKVANIVGVLISHEHLDHSKSKKDFENMGTPVYAPYEEQGIAYVDWGGYRIKAFSLPHDGTQNYGFLISCDGMKVLYMTDFEYCQYNFKSLNVDHILIECNYMDEMVDEDAANFNHKVLGHASLSTCKDFVSANRTDALKTVVLLHLGSETSDPNKMMVAISKVARNGVHIDYARHGLKLDLIDKDWCPF